VFENCQTKCILPNEFFANVDSMFVYNNIFQDVGNAIGFWQGVTDINGVNCIRNVFISNNTIIGMRGMPSTVNWPLINFFFPSYNLVFNSFYSYLQNVKITNNIFTYDTVAYPLIEPVSKVFNALHPGPQDVAFDGNIWVQPHAYFGSNDIVRSELPGSTYFLGDSLFSILPCPDNLPWVYAQPAAFSFLTNDYKGMPRNSSATNVGALEYDATCSSPILGVQDFMLNAEVNVYPNPCFDCQKISFSNLPESNNLHYTLYTVEGSIITEGTLLNNTIWLETSFEGMAILLVRSNNHKSFHKLVMYKD
jgi:hypothetical protein